MKPKSGARGTKVYFLGYNSDDILIAIDEEKQLLSIDEFKSFISNNVKIKDYVFQKYISSRTIDGNPFDIRVHLMRNHNNEWENLIMVPRVGHDYAKISLLSNGGYIADWKGFINRNYSQDLARKINRDIKEISLQSIDVFEKVFDNKISEVGIDFGISKEGNIYFIEMNVNKPTAAYLKYDLAFCGVGYANYLIKNKSENDFLLVE